MKRNAAQRGFTLVELMITLTLIAVLLVLALPSFSSSRLNTVLRTSANNLLAGTHLARAEAIKRNSPVTMCVSADGLACGSGDWNQGWIVIDESATPDEVVYREDAISNLFHITSGGTDEFAFQPTGVNSTAGSFTICRATPVGPNERVLTVDAIGRARISRTSAGVCP
jgi:type IV fimbrial biogenesis protein FimT